MFHALRYIEVNFSGVMFGLLFYNVPHRNGEGEGLMIYGGYFTQELSSREDL
jgi:hypothetical protein